MNCADAFQCLQFQGQKLQYVDGNNEVQTRTLETVTFNSVTKKYEASFKYKNIVKKALYVSKVVPLDRVLLPRITSPEMWRRNTTHNSSKVATATTIQYYGYCYKVTIRENFKTDDHVVWLTFSSKEDACIGRIVVTAEREDVMGQVHFAAVVGLERAPMAGNGGVPPRHINYLGMKNTFLVPEKELLKLDEWVRSMTTTEEMEIRNEENDWIVVSKRRNGSKGGQRPKSASEDLIQSPIPSTSKSSSCKNPENNYKGNRERFLHSPDMVRRQKKTQQQLRHRSRSPKTFDDDDQNYVKETCPESEDDWRHSLVKETLFQVIKQKDGYGMGVQGNDNSCYMDASLFALFSFTDALDKVIAAGENKTSSEASSDSSSQLKDLLKSNVIFQMRQAPYFVPNCSIKKMRKIFGNVFNKEYLSRFMDVEDFLGDFFKLLDAPPFFHYDSGEADYIHQIALPFTWDRKNDYQRYLSLQTLLENSFKTFQVKLEKMPEDIFIVKLPVSDGVLIPCEGVIPDLTLDLAKVLETNSKKEKKSTKMALCSVICLRNNHFVAWVRTGKILNSTWVYMDSRPTIQVPYVCHLPDVDQIIRNAVEELNNGQDGCNIGSYEPQCENYYLFRHAYVCIYVKQ